MDKNNLIEKVVDDIEQEASKMKESFESSRKAANEAPGAMQSKSDTTKSQMSTLAANFHSSHTKIRNCISTIKRLDLSIVYRAVGVGAVVRVKEKDEKRVGERYYFILPPYGGTREIEYDGKKICTITVDSPMGKALFGKKVGDIIKFNVPAGTKILKVLSIE